jgi:hypothetical protein
MVTRIWLMIGRFSRRFPGLFAVLLGLYPCAPCAAEPSLANLLTGSASADPKAETLAQLASELASVERRPFAQDSAVQRALGDARAELAGVRAAYAAGASAPAVERGIALVRAILSAADRLEARVFAAAALARLKAQAAAAEDAARAAQSALAQAKSSEHKP